MRINLRRAAVLAGAALGLLATAVPSAHATSGGSITFQGTASLSGGLSYPCVGTSTPNTAKCPTPSATTTKPGTVEGGNSRGFTFSASVCVAAGATTLSGNGGGAGTCTILAAGVVTGSCGLSSGLGTYTEKEDKTAVQANPPALVTLLTVRNGNFHFTGLGGTLVITGDVAGGGTIAGVVEAVPVPTVSGTTLDNSCSGKTADEFTIAGEVAFAQA